MTQRDVSEFLGGYQPPRLTCRITMRANLLSEVERLIHAHTVAEREDAQSNEAPKAPGIFRRIEELQEEIRASEFEFEFEAMPKRRYEALLDQHPPTDEHRAIGLGYNADTFPTALIAACAVNPKLTLADVEELERRVTDKQFGKLWATAAAVNIGDDAAPKFVRSSALAAMSETLLPTAPSTESPEASSSDDS